MVNHQKVAHETVRKLSVSLYPSTQLIIELIQKRWHAQPCVGRILVGCSIAWWLTCLGCSRDWPDNCEPRVDSATPCRGLLRECPNGFAMQRPIPLSVGFSNCAAGEYRDRATVSNIYLP